MSTNGSPPNKIKRVATKINDERSCKRCDILEQKIDEIKGQLKFIGDTLGEQNGMLLALLREKTETQSLKKKFPIKSDESLININNEINSGNRDLYIQAMRSLIQPAGVEKNLKYILPNELIIEYNIDGIHGKKCLKNLDNFYTALTESIPHSDKETAEAKLRKAIQLQKKRHFKNVCIAKAASEKRS